MTPMIPSDIMFDRRSTSQWKMNPLQKHVKMLNAIYPKSHSLDLSPMDEEYSKLLFYCNLKPYRLPKIMHLLHQRVLSDIQQKNAGYIKLSLKLCNDMMDLFGTQSCLIAQFHLEILKDIFLSSQNEAHFPAMVTFHKFMERYEIDFCFGENLLDRINSTAVAIAKVIINTPSNNCSIGCVVKGFTAIISIMQKMKWNLLKSSLDNVAHIQRIIMGFIKKQFTPNDSSLRSKLMLIRRRKINSAEELRKEFSIDDPHLIKIMSYFCIKLILDYECIFPSSGIIMNAMISELYGDECVNAFIEICSNIITIMESSCKILWIRTLIPILNTKWKNDHDKKTYILSVILCIVANNPDVVDSYQQSMDLILILRKAYIDICTGTFLDNNFLTPNDRQLICVLRDMIAVNLNGPATVTEKSSGKHSFYNCSIDYLVEAISLCLYPNPSEKLALDEILERVMKTKRELLIDVLNCCNTMIWDAMKTGTTEHGINKPEDKNTCLDIQSNRGLYISLNRLCEIILPFTFVHDKEIVGMVFKLVFQNYARFTELKINLDTVTADETSAPQFEENRDEEAPDHLQNIAYLLLDKYYDVTIKPFIMFYQIIRMSLVQGSKTAPINFLKTSCSLISGIMRESHDIDNLRIFITTLIDHTKFISTLPGYESVSSILTGLSAHPLETICIDMKFIKEDAEYCLERSEKEACSILGPPELFPHTSQSMRICLIDFHDNTRAWLEKNHPSSSEIPCAQEYYRTIETEIARLTSRYFPEIQVESKIGHSRRAVELEPVDNNSTSKFSDFLVTSLEEVFKPNTSDSTTNPDRSDRDSISSKEREAGAAVSTEGDIDASNADALLDSKIEHLLAEVEECPTRKSVPTIKHIYFALPLVAVIEDRKYTNFREGSDKAHPKGFR